MLKLDDILICIKKHKLNELVFVDTGDFFRINESDILINGIPMYLLKNIPNIGINYLFHMNREDSDNICYGYIWDHFISDKLYGVKTKTRKMLNL